MRQQRAVLAQQQPTVGAEGSVKPDGVGCDSGGERRAVATLADTVHGSQRGTDERQVRGIGGERRGQLRIDGRGAHPDLELRRAGGGGVEVDGRAGSHGIRSSVTAMLGAEDRRHLVDRLMLGAVLCCVHADRRGRHDPAALPGRDGDRGEGSTLVVAGGLIPNGFVGPAFAREHRMLGFDGLVRSRSGRRFGGIGRAAARRTRGGNPAADCALELGHVVAGAPLRRPRRHRMKIKACEQIGPEIGHALSVSLVLRQRERNSRG